MNLDQFLIEMIIIYNIFLQLNLYPIISNKQKILTLYYIKYF